MYCEYDDVSIGFENIFDDRINMFRLNGIVFDLHAPIHDKRRTTIISRKAISERRTVQIAIDANKRRSGEPVILQKSPDDIKLIINGTRH